MPVISIIMPAYNVERYIDQAIDSVLSQSDRDWELVIVDDGSTDGTADVVGRYQDARISVIRQQNQGLAGARNTGILAARGELVALLDSDDRWRPRFLEMMRRLAAERPDAAVYYCRARGIDADGAELPQVFGGSPTSSDRLYDTLVRANFLIPSTIVCRRSAILRAGLFDRSLRSCEDWDLWLRMLPGHTFAGTVECLTEYRVHGGTLSTNPHGMQSASRAVVEKHFGSDDGREATWQSVKRRAYGGLYRYYVLTSVQRQGDWKAAADYLLRAVQVDPSLSVDIDLFYDLALGSQPVGFRGSAHHLDLDASGVRIEQLVQRAFELPGAEVVASLRGVTSGTAYYALGLVSYLGERRFQSRRYLIKALRYRRELCRDGRLANHLAMSFFGRSTLARLRGLLRQNQHRLSSVA